MSLKKLYDEVTAPAPTMTAEIERLRSLTIDELVARYTLEFGKPPRMKQKEFLWKRIAWKIQEKRLGGLSTLARERLEALISEISIPLDECRRRVSGKLRMSGPPKPPGAPKEGVVLTKVWREKTYHVRAVEDGRYLLEKSGVVYKSLSAVAFGITNTHWNGKLFFGLVTRGKSSNKSNHSEKE